MQNPIFKIARVRFFRTIVGHKRSWRFLTKRLGWQGTGDKGARGYLEHYAVQNFNEVVVKDELLNNSAIRMSKNPR